MAKKQVCGDKWIQLLQDEQGNMIVDMDDGVVIVPLNAANEILFISEPSIAYDGLRSLLLPAGALEPDEDPAHSANRELQEELGYKANRLDSLGVIYSSIKYVNEKFHIYLARDLEVSQLAGDEPDGWIESQAPVPLSTFESLIAEGKLLNASTIAALYMARSFITNEEA